jgi:hypothetical protein
MKGKQFVETILLTWCTFCSAIFRDEMCQTAFRSIQLIKRSTITRTKSQRRLSPTEFNNREQTTAQGRHKLRGIL